MVSLEKRIGIIGVGLLGTAITERLRAAGYRVLAWDRDAARLSAAGGLLAGFLCSALGGDYARVGTVGAMIYALGMVIIWLAPDQRSDNLQG
jgi:lactate dehydrogenase-like 2-hydroxyacid dehydrogenase